MAALALLADTLFVSVAAEASGGGGIGVYTMNVRVIFLTFNVLPETEVMACFYARKYKVTSLQGSAMAHRY